MNDTLKNVTEHQNQLLSEMQTELKTQVTPNATPAADNPLLSEIQNSITDMQNHMQSVYQGLSEEHVMGEHDGVSITMTATYGFVDINFTEKALQGGVQKFKERIKLAWEAVVKKVQEKTQAQTLELLQQMQIPDEIKAMSAQAAQGAQKTREDEE